MSSVLYLAFRALHVLFAAVWLGSSVFISMMLMPAIDQSGPSGGQVMVRISRRGVSAFMSSAATITVVTGVYLLWRFTGGFDPAVAATHAGAAFVVGGGAGILASIVGGAVVGRNSAKVSEIMAQMATADAAAKGALIERAVALRKQMKAGSTIVVAMQGLALILMTLAHYI